MSGLMVAVLRYHLAIGTLTEAPAFLQKTQ